MYSLIPEIPNHRHIRNLIFDFGGVICPLDIPKTEKMFREFGPPKQTNNKPNQFQLLVDALETDAVTPQQFRETIRNHYQIPPTDKTIDDTWNAMIMDIPEHRITLLSELKHDFRIFLLSNSNRIHYDFYVRGFRQQTGLNDFNGLFEKAWFSFEIKLKKPGREIFDFVLADARLNPIETLFIDDTPENVQGSEIAGITGYHLSDGKEIRDLFRKIN